MKDLRIVWEGMYTTFRTGVQIPVRIVSRLVVEMAQHTQSDGEPWREVKGIVRDKILAQATAGSTPAPEYEMLRAEIDMLRGVGGCMEDGDGPCGVCIKCALRGDHVESRKTGLPALRSAGWMVAVHNDYRLNGRRMTFWLFTKGDRAVKGEGETDSEALAQVAAQVAALEAKTPA